MTIEQEKQLRLQRRAGSAAVEVREKGILGLLEDRRGIEPCRQTFCERALAHTDWSFDRDVLKRHERGAGRSPRGCMLSSRADVHGDRDAAQSNLPDADCHVPCADHRGLRLGSHGFTWDAYRSSYHLGTEDRVDGSSGGSAYSPRSESTGAGCAEACDAA